MYSYVFEASFSYRYKVRFPSLSSSILLIKYKINSFIINLAAWVKHELRVQRMEELVPLFPITHPKHVCGFLYLWWHYKAMMKCVCVCGCPSVQVCIPFWIFRISWGRWNDHCTKTVALHCFHMTFTKKHSFCLRVLRRSGFMYLISYPSFSQFHGVFTIGKEMFKFYPRLAKWKKSWLLGNIRHT